MTEEDIRRARLDLGVRTTFKTVDGAEFEATRSITTAPMRTRTRWSPPIAPGPGVGPEPDRPGIEFDYCCVHALLALQAAGYETIMPNCNPEDGVATPRTGCTSSR